jgi:hypothetical protein
MDDSSESAVERLSAAVDALLGEELPDGTRLVELLRAVEAQRSRLEAVDQRLLAHAQASSLAGELGRTALIDVLTAALRIDPAQARARIERTEHLAVRRSLTGDVLGPLLPETAGAVAAGSVSREQTDVVLACLEAIPPAAPAAAWPVAEQLLLRAARYETPRQLRRTAAELLARLDPDGLEPVEERAERRRSFTLIPRPDGTAIARGVWTAELTALWQAILDTLAAPQPAGDQPDVRSPGQRRHDAMAEAAGRLLRSGTLPTCGGLPVTILATTRVTAREAGPGSTGRAPTRGVGRGHSAVRFGPARIGHGQHISARQLQALSGDAAITPVLLDLAGGVVAYGRTRRLAAPGQRLALAARDGGCSFPGCDRPAPWTEVHHVVAWADGGSTDLDNLTLICRHHHRTFEQAGWQVRMTNGRPEWLPPPWLDRQRAPRRNTVHPPADLELPAPRAPATVGA